MQYFRFVFMKRTTTRTTKEWQTHSGSRLLIWPISRVCFKSSLNVTAELFGSIGILTARRRSSLVSFSAGKSCEVQTLTISKSRSLRLAPWPGLSMPFDSSLHGHHTSLPWEAGLQALISSRSDSSYCTQRPALRARIIQSCPSPRGKKGRREKSTPSSTH